MNISIHVQKQYPHFDLPYPGVGKNVMIETVDQTGTVVVRDGGTGVLSGFRTILRDGKLQQIPELVLLVTPTTIEL